MKLFSKYFTINKLIKFNTKKTDSFNDVKNNHQFLACPLTFSDCVGIKCSFKFQTIYFLIIKDQNCDILMKYFIHGGIE